MDVNQISRTTVRKEKSVSGGRAASEGMLCREAVAGVGATATNLGGECGSRSVATGISSPAATVGFICGASGQFSQLPRFEWSACRCPDFVSSQHECALLPSGRGPLAAAADGQGQSRRATARRPTSQKRKSMVVWRLLTWRKYHSPFPARKRLTGCDPVDRRPAQGSGTQPR